MSEWEFVLRDDSRQLRASALSRLVYTYDTSISISASISIRQSTCEPADISILSICIRKRNSFLFLMFMLMLSAILRLSLSASSTNMSHKTMDVLWLTFFNQESTFLTSKLCFGSLVQQFLAAAHMEVENYSSTTHVISPSSYVTSACSVSHNRLLTYLMLQVWTGWHKHKHKENKSICCQRIYTENSLQSRSDCSDHSVHHHDSHHALLIKMWMHCTCVCCLVLMLIARVNQPLLITAQESGFLLWNTHCSLK